MIIKLTSYIFYVSMIQTQPDCQMPDRCCILLVLAVQHAFLDAYDVKIYKRDLQKNIINKKVNYHEKLASNIKYFYKYSSPTTQQYKNYAPQRLQQFTVHSF